MAATWESNTPRCPFPEITFRAPATVPPTMFPLVWEKMETPFNTLPIARVPVWSVPIRFPCSLFPVVPAPVMDTPLPPLPEIRLPKPIEVPPIVTLSAPPSTWIPV